MLFHLFLAVTMMVVSGSVIVLFWGALPMIVVYLLLVVNLIMLVVVGANLYISEGSRSLTLWVMLVLLLLLFFVLLLLLGVRSVDLFAVINNYTKKTVGLELSESLGPNPMPSVDMWLAMFSLSSTVQTPAVTALQFYCEVVLTSVFMVSVFALTMYAITPAIYWMTEGMQPWAAQGPGQAPVAPVGAGTPQAPVVQPRVSLTQAINNRQLCLNYVQDMQLLDPQRTQLLGAAIATLAPLLNARQGLWDMWRESAGRFHLDLNQGQLIFPNLNMASWSAVERVSVLYTQEQIRHEFLRARTLEALIQSLLRLMDDPRASRLYLETYLFDIARAWLDSPLSP